MLNEVHVKTNDKTLYDDYISYFKSFADGSVVVCKVNEVSTYIYIGLNKYKKYIKNLSKVI